MVGSLHHGKGVQLKTKNKKRAKAALGYLKDALGYLESAFSSFVKMEKKRAFAIYQKKVAVSVFQAQQKELEDDLSVRVAGFIRGQIVDASKNLISSAKDFEAGGESKSVKGLAPKVFNPRDWDLELIQTVAKPLSEAACKAMVAQSIEMRSQIKSYSRLGFKASTASDYLDARELHFKDYPLPTPYGEVFIRVPTEFPPWMKDAIKSNLQESFNQPYWAGINDTTDGDIDGFLEQAITDGMAPRETAKTMLQRYGSDYPMTRGLNIARTESGNALNGARSKSMDALIDELGMADVIKKVWLSVLSKTTRDEHAHLDGVPAASDGTWVLAGIKIRWPSDVRLPASQRCNCFCTIVSQFGMTNSTADELIQEYNDITTKSFCPTGPGGGVDPTCSPGKSKTNLLNIPTGVGAASSYHQANLKSLQKMMDSGDHTTALDTAQKLHDLKVDPLYSKAYQTIKDEVDSQANKPPAGAVPTTAPGVSSGSNWVKTGPQLGTEKGGTYEMGGQKFYVKQPDNPDRALNEVVALKLYAAAGAQAVNGHIVDIDGKISVATDWLDSQKANWKDPSTRQAAAEDFAVHAWLNNRDAVGAGSENPMDNIRIADGQPVLVDAGGSLAYSGMGGSGKKIFEKDATVEFNAMRNSDINPSMAKVFGDMTPEQLVKSIDKLKNIDDQTINQLVNKYGPGNTVEKAILINTLIDRKKSLIDMGEAMKKVLQPKANDPPPAVPKAAAKSGAMTVPPPPALTSKSAQSWQEKMNAIYEASKTGDVNKVHQAVKVNMEATSPYPKKLAEYKAQVIAAMQSGGEPHTKIPGKVTPSPTPDLLTTLKIDPSKFLKPPIFSSKDFAKVAENQATVAKAWDMAAAGDLAGLQSLQSASPKVQAWKAQLTSTVADQLNPSPPQKYLVPDFADIVAAAPSAKSPVLSKIGYWNVLGSVSVAEEGYSESQYASPDVKAKLHNDGESVVVSLDLRPHVQYYTGIGYHDMNDSLRESKPTGEAAALAQKIIKSGVSIPVGTRLERSHKDLGGWDNVKPGTVMTDKGILSTSLSERDGFNGSIRLIMQVGSGVKGLPVKNVSGFKLEDEILLAPNQRIMVTKVEPGVYGSKLVHAVILPTEDNQCCPP